MIARYGTFEYALSDRYRFEEELGRGAMGTVYRATDVRLGRPVAIKMLHPALANETSAKRFLSEIRIAAGLHHPCIIGVHESGECDGRLFFVMDYLGGETLRARLTREKQLSVEDSLHIVEQVGDALQYAHDHGVVHRDVKPENILLAEGRACLVDFGLSRAFGDVDAERLTQSGLSVGTPHYLSPEQAAAERQVGPAADQYALACVLYEMLAGEPPFTGPTASAIAMRHITATAVPLSTRRHTVTPAIDVAVSRAMEKVPADRYPNLREFIHALRRATGRLDASVGAPRRTQRRRVVMAGGAVAGIAGLLWLGFPSRARVAQVIGGDVQLDSAAIAVMPLDAPAELRSVSDDWRDAFASWADMHVVGAADIVAAAGTGAAAASTPARDIARRLNARRYVTGRIRGTPTSFDIVAEIHDANRGDVYERRVASGSGARSESDDMRAMAATLLLRREIGKDEMPAVAGTRSIRALAQFLAGREALRAWNLRLADSSFSRALRIDASFGQAALGLATTRQLAADAGADVAALATRALGGRSLAPRDSTRAHALRALASGQFVQACARFDSLTRSDAQDAEAWFGASECRVLDDSVVVDDPTAGRAHFRGSFHYAGVALRHALELRPNVDGCCQRRIVELIRRQYKYAQSPRLRIGFSIGRPSNVYLASPELQTDTVAFIPRPGNLRQELVAPALQAVDQQQLALMNIASARLALAPQSADMLELMADALELRSDGAARDTLHRAQLMSKDPDQQLRLAVNDLWLRLKYSLPDEVAELRRARQLADSLMKFAQARTVAQADLLAPVAAIAMQPAKAAALQAQSERAHPPGDLPADVAAAGAALVTYAAFHGPIDSLHALENRLEIGLRNSAAPQGRSLATTVYFTRAAMLAFPAYPLRALSSVSGIDPLIGAEAAFARKDALRARALLEQVQAVRERVRPAERTIDALVPQAWLFAALGDTVSAVGAIAPTLDAMRAVQRWRLSSSVASAASLVQGARLLAQLGPRGGRAARWAAAVDALGW